MSDSTRDRLAQDTLSTARLESADLTDEIDLKAEIEAVVRQFGGLDIVVCNAGIFKAGEYIVPAETGNSN